MFYKWIEILKPFLSRLVIAEELLYCISYCSNSTTTELVAQMIRASIMERHRFES